MKLSPSDIDNLLDLALLSQIDPDPATVEAVRLLLYREVSEQAERSRDWHDRVLDDTQRRIARREKG